MAEIVLDGVTKRYPDGSVAVSEVNLEIADGEFVILVGPSGCGKSTTLNMIAGLEDITAGELRIGGERMNERPPRDRDIAMVFQSYALYPHMTVRQNLAFPLKIAKVDKSTITAKVARAAEILDLTEHLDRKPSHLSGGQRQRVAMGRAIVRNPKAFLLDEPLSNLDAKLRVQMRTEVARLQQRLGTTTVYVTHDQTEAMTLGDRVVVMRAGVVQQVGPPQYLYDHPENLFVAGFIGSPSMNFIPAQIADSLMHTPLGEFPLPHRIRAALENAPGNPREVILGIRPEHFEDAELVEEAARADGVTFTGTVEVVESTGSDKYAYFASAGTHASSAELEELAADSGAAEVAGAAGSLTTRLAPASKAAKGATLTVWFDLASAHVFDPESGRNLTTDLAA
ncbi:MAG TPA: sn-glycerol-3-phosphate ABC transporter ATP-binding protein UgpC [Sporichthya sp.]|nr:sn-glycerol-3-phosphate ABC transporter ATP-binding protein UgpC [Sporichthya sp.]